MGISNERFICGETIAQVIFCLRNEDTAPV